MFATLILSILLYQSIDEFEAKELCEEVASYPIPAFLQEPTQNKDCFALFYGIRVPQDRRLAAQCCVQTQECPQYAAMAFANGWGVKRDRKVATRLLCESKRIAPAELWSMLEHLQQKKTDLDYCEHITSGRGATLCARLEGARLAPQLDRRIRTVRKPLSAEAAAKLEVLMKEAGAFAVAEGERVGDDSRGGTLYPSAVVNAQTAERSATVEMIERYSSKRAPSASTKQLSEAAVALDAAIEAQMKVMSDCEECRENIRKSQSSWIRYRDAFADYYAAKWSAPREDVILRLTRERIQSLQ